MGMTERSSLILLHCWHCGATSRRSPAGELFMPCTSCWRNDMHVTRNLDATKATRAEIEARTAHGHEQIAADRAPKQRCAVCGHETIETSNECWWCRKVAHAAGQVG